MKFARKRMRDRLRVGVDMTPFIDVVLLLVLFFMLSSTFVVQASIPVELSESDSSEQFEQKDATVTLSFGEGGPDNLGKVFYSEEDSVEIAAWADLTSRLTDFRQRRPEGLLLVRPDRRVSAERLVRVLGIANNVGIQRYGIAAIPPAPETAKESN